MLFFLRIKIGFVNIYAPSRGIVLRVVKLLLKYIFLLFYELLKYLYIYKCYYSQNNIEEILFFTSKSSSITLPKLVIDNMTKFPVDDKNFPYLLLVEGEGEAFVCADTFFLFMVCTS